MQYQFIIGVAILFGKVTNNRKTKISHFNTWGHITEGNHNN